MSENPGAADRIMRGPRPTTVDRHLAKAQRRGPGTIWRPDPRDHGLLGLTDAIHWFGANG